MNNKGDDVCAWEGHSLGGVQKMVRVCMWVSRLNIAPTPEPLEGTRVKQFGIFK